MRKLAHVLRRIRRRPSGFLPPGTLEFLEEKAEMPKWADLWGIDPDFTPPKTEVPRFESGHGRPDLDMLHNVLHMLDMDEEPYYVREVVARYLNTRPDDINSRRRTGP